MCPVMDAAAEFWLDLRWRVTHPEFWAAHGGGALAQALVLDDFLGERFSIESSTCWKGYTSNWSLNRLSIG